MSGKKFENKFTCNFFGKRMNRNRAGIGEGEIEMELWGIINISSIIVKFLQLKFPNVPAELFPLILICSCQNSPVKVFKFSS